MYRTPAGWLVCGKVGDHLFSHCAALATPLRDLTATLSAGAGIGSERDGNA
jgi:hypothetical protein